MAQLLLWAFIARWRAAGQANLFDGAGEALMDGFPTQKILYAGGCAAETGIPLHQFQIGLFQTFRKHLYERAIWRCRRAA